MSLMGLPNKKPKTQAPLSMEFLRQEYYIGLPFPSPVHFPDLEIEPKSLVSPSLAGGFFTTVPSGEPQFPYEELQTERHRKSKKSA